MKMNTALAAIALLWTSASFACPHSEQQFMCPGDPVVDSGGASGTVVAINPFQKTVAIYEPSYSQNYTYNINTVALGIGCLEGYCVGDTVVDSGGASGKIVAVNPYTRQVAIYEPSYSQNYLYSIDTVAIGYGCVGGYCVGDQVVDAGGASGEIVALNPATGQAAVYEASYSQNYVYAIATLANSNFCATYGAYERSMPRYPRLNTQLYASPTFHFSLRH